VEEKEMRRLIDASLVLVIACTAGIVPAMAGIPVGAPAPVIGLGIPAIAAFGLLYKRMRDRQGK
jgi:hypothetical protein